MESFKTDCPACGEIDHPIDYYSHDEYSYEKECGVCGIRLPNVDDDADSALVGEVSSQIDMAMNYYEN